MYKFGHSKKHTVCSNSFDFLQESIIGFWHSVIASAACVCVWSTLLTVVSPQTACRFFASSLEHFWFDLSTCDHVAGEFAAKINGLLNKRLTCAREWCNAKLIDFRRLCVLSLNNAFNFMKGSFMDHAKNDAITNKGSQIECASINKVVNAAIQKPIIIESWAMIFGAN